MKGKRTGPPPAATAKTAPGKKAAANPVACAAASKNRKVAGSKA